MDLAGKNYTYLGTADDVSLRYPWDVGCKQESLEDQMISAAIYEQILAINDGYIVANKNLLPALIELDRSLLGNLLHSHSAVLFSRSEPKNIAAGIENSAKKITTHKQIVENDKRWPKARKSIEKLQVSLAGTTVRWPPDKNMGAIFYKMLEQLYFDQRYKLAVPEYLQKDFDDIFLKFNHEINSNYDGARDLWENVVWRHYTQKDVNPFAMFLSKKKHYPKVKLLMQLANEAYHIAYTCALNHSLTQKDNSLSARPMTAICPAYSDLFAKDTAEFIDLKKMKIICENTIPINSGMFKKNADYKWVWKLQFNPDLSEYRSNYVSAINDFITDSKNEKQLRKARNQYLNSLLNELGDQLSLKTTVIKSAASWIPGAVLSLPLLAVDPLLSAMGGLSISLFCDRFGAKIYQKIIDVPKAKKLINKRKNEISIEKLIRGSGLINSTLNKKSVDNFLIDIKPYGES